MPPGHGDRRKYLSNLALRLARRYERSKDRVDIDKAIEIGDQVLKAVPEDHADRMAMLSNHALWYMKDKRPMMFKGHPDW